MAQKTKHSKCKCDLNVDIDRTKTYRLDIADDDHLSCEMAYKLKCGCNA